MDMYGQKDKSTPQKIVMKLFEIVILFLSFWILFGNGYSTITGNENPSGLFARHVILFVFNCIVFIRITFTMFYLIKRRIPWDEAFSIPVAYAVYYIGFAMIGYTCKTELSFIDDIAIALFLSGSYLNTRSELARDKWKKDPSNKGKLYTEGLFRYSMHINYFGDLLWVIAYAVVTRNIYSVFIPAFLFLFFAFYNIPKLDKYLAGRYGKQFEEYSKRTKKFIPYIF